MKNLIILNGTMGVGKTATCRALQKRLPKNVFLDGDWCWDMVPFQVTKETKDMVIDNITYQLNNFLRCSAYENVLFCWVMDSQETLDKVLSLLDLTNCAVRCYSLICTEEALTARVSRDIRAGLRPDHALQYCIPRLANYAAMDTVKVDVSILTPEQAADLIYNQSDDWD
ncbi:MAG: AAA family ATPase [Oscillospiraceae bacterium]